MKTSKRKKNKQGNLSTINAPDYTNEEEEEEDVNAVRFQNNFRGNNNRGRNYNNRNCFADVNLNV